MHKIIVWQFWQDVIIRKVFEARPYFDRSIDSKLYRIVIVFVYIIKDKNIFLHLLYILRFTNTSNKVAEGSIVQSVNR